MHNFFKLICTFLIVMGSSLWSSSKPIRLGIRHIESKGVGYNQGYTTFEGFAAYNGDRNVPFIDLRGHVFDNGKWAANTGIGFRSLWGCRSYGINAYYDYRRTSEQHNFQQIGIGLESLGRRWDFRANGYFPFGSKLKNFGSPQFVQFSGNHLFICQNAEFVMSGLNAEIGMHIARMKHFDFFMGAGPYYYARRDSSKNAIGGKLRILGKFRDYVSMELSGSYDPVFRTIVQGEVGLHLPFGPRKKDKTSSCAHFSCIREDIVQPVIRNEIIVLDQRCKESIAINPETGLPFNFIFVDNTSSSNGTIESPFPSLTLAQNASLPSDIIYVFPGNGTSQGMNLGFVMKDNQKIWGAGINHTLTTTIGQTVVPAQSSGFPLLTNTNLNVPIIQLANSCEVSGFQFTSSNVGDGILGGENTDSFPSTLGISNALIQNNVFTAMQVRKGAIALGNCSGNLTIINNTIAGVTSASFPGGITISNGTVPVSSTLIISNNNISQTDQNGILVIHDSPSGHLDGTIENNSISTSLGTHAIFFGSSTSGGGGGSLCGMIENNQLQNNDNTSTLIVTAGGTTAIIAEVSGNILTNNIVTSGRGIEVSTTDSSSLCLRLLNNRSDNGYLLTQGISTTFNLEPPEGNIGTPFTVEGTTPVNPGTCNCQ